ncbi:hypothetical protein [Weissella diestrammenae]|uniref:hypothetical protein n=1 Tax=Weissella diestrammenae TaxID=1162633 RepID=UPI00195FE098|nr:hypothetical protein [Weissella diestrammenae]MCM0583210.1 hypothetical protein [Weissella diestrammenae]
MNINLINQYNEETNLVNNTLKKIFKEFVTVSIENDGFLTTGTYSPTDYFSERENMEKKYAKRGRYYNEVLVPKYWEIIGFGNDAQILDGNQLRGRIIYSSSRLRNRIVASVEWFETSGKIYKKDYYDQYGTIYKEVQYVDNQPVTEFYLNPQGQIRIQHSLKSGLYTIFQANGDMKAYNNVIDLTKAYIEAKFVNIDKLFFNSLSVDFMVANRITSAKESVLMWHEKIGTAIPGNMLTFLSNEELSRKVIIQDKTSYENFDQIYEGNDRDKVHYLNYNYTLEPRSNRLEHNNAFVLTNTDDVVNLGALIKNAPSIHFHIAAFTQMSDKLKQFESEDNVTLYQSANTIVIDNIWDKTDIYLDINRGSEMDNVLKTAFIRQIPIIGFTSTIHNQKFVHKKGQYLETNESEMIRDLNMIADNSDEWRNLVDQQIANVDMATLDDYRAVMGLH